MSPLSALRRVRAYGGQFTLLAVLAMVTALLVTGVPRIADRLTEEGLRQYLAAQPATQRDILYTADPGGSGLSMTNAPARAGKLAELHQAMPEPLRRVIGEQWYAAQTGFLTTKGADLTAARLRVELGLRTVSGVREAATLTGGRWPTDDREPRSPIEVALAVDVARQLGLKVGSRLWMSVLGPDGETEVSRTAVVVTGIFAAADQAGGIWDSLPTPLRVAPPIGDGPFLAVAVTSDAHIDAVRWPVTYSWRYRVDNGRIDARDLAAVTAAAAEITRNRPPELRLSQGVDLLLDDFVDSLTASRTLLAVISAGVLATLAGLVGLAAALAVRRRRAEFVLLRARGGSSGTVAGRSLVEALLVIPLAVAAGWSAGLLLPGSSAGATWPVAVVALLITLALPVLTLASRGGPAGRQDVTSARPSVRRLTAEVTVLVVAVLAAYLLRRRGLADDGTIDPLLVSVPVLLAVAAALVALRAYPWPVRLAGNLAARSRGSVAFLGLARAGRGSATAPLVVVVIAVATAAFCGVVATGIGDGRDQAATRAVPGDALLTAEGFAPDTRDQLAGLPGVRAVMPLLAQTGQPIFPDTARQAADVSNVSVLMVDGPAFARVVADAQVAVDLPGALTGPVPADGPVPALVSPAVAADLSAAGLTDPFVQVQGSRYAFRPAGTVDDFPLLTGAGDRFVVLAWPARPAFAERPLTPTGFLLAGTPSDPAALQRLGDDGQRRYHETGLVTGGAPDRPSVVTTWAQARADLGGRGVNGLLSFAFVAGTGGAVLLGLLAIAFAVLAGARSRGQVLSRLRTLGLSRRQWRGLLALELAPLVGAAVLTGAVVGALLPVLLNPVLGLAEFTGGAPVRVQFEPGLVGGIVGLGALALGFAVVVEALNNRRMRLGEVLRLGEES
ncbi:FtsX-like permease family protein [Micromonospora sp. CPCC 206060]|uniref:FtsX-like permease family protein n=1 Tax=Micromonospora sp. CPCC 206060 TaxID=3122406 RepID=UPI002FF40C50